MSTQDRNKERLSIFNFMIMSVQIFGLHSTRGLFEMEFEFQMKKRTGECTEEDLAWMHKQLNEFIDRNKD